jgi:dTDP-L-rhamnose 4-epimerase
MAHILITGGAGFIGSHTAHALVQQGHRVRLLDCLDPQIHGADAIFPRELSAQVECLQGDVRNTGDLVGALDGIEAVYHFAALTGVGQSMYDLRAYTDVNVTGTASLLEAILKRGAPLPRVILASSRAVYGEGTHRCAIHGAVYPEPRHREDLEAGDFAAHCPRCGAVAVSTPTVEDRPLKPLSIYALTKLQQEELCAQVTMSHGLPLVILRYFNVYGSRQSLRNPYTGVVSIFYSRMRAGQPVSLYERGLPGRDFVHVSDVVRANLIALHAEPATGMRYNIGAGYEHSIAEIASTLATAAGFTARFEDHGEFRVGDIRSCYADLTAARAGLGFEPQITLEEGLREFSAWAAGEIAEDRYQKTVDELARYNLFGCAGPPRA